VRNLGNWLIRRHTKNMQTLEKRNTYTYTPPNASLVRCNCDPALNREETLGVLGLKTLSNTSEVNLLVRKFQTTELVSLCLQKLPSINYELGSRFVNPASAISRGTIHPRPFGTGYSRPLDPTKINSLNNYENHR
jgi:hypothetical protein